MYSMSTHKKFWTFESEKKLDELRREAREMFIKKLVDSIETESAQKALLTVDEERMFRSMVEENALKFCRSFEPPLPTRVIYTAFVHFKRFYLNTSLLRYLNAKNIMTAIIYLASKIEDSYIPIDTFVSKLKSGRPEDNVAMIRNLEPILIKRLCSHLVVHEPFTPLEGFYILLMEGTAHAKRVILKGSAGRVGCTETAHRGNDRAGMDWGTRNSAADLYECWELVELDPTQTQDEMALKLGVSRQTMCDYLKQLGKVKKLDKWVPHELSEQQMFRRLEQCFPEFSKHDREIRLASENFLWNSLITDACLLYSPSQVCNIVFYSLFANALTKCTQIALTAIFAALKEENMEGFQRLVAMAIRDDNSEKANRLIEKVHECYALVSECPAVPPEFGTLIQKRINECVEFINRAVSAAQTTRTSSVSSNSESSSDSD
ncbi:hypothetical protein M514_06332 [Trichuris suis]|uniref:Cyclin-like domain-containing protein n=1 Tax=Trichuris suis TaxID=68888 RepID=A0A085N622_9BILA|nr:hypothetical protein M514_06332 [Trichuris suis]